MTWFEWISAHSFSFDLFVPLMVFYSSCLHCYLFIPIYIPCSIFSTHHSYTSHQQFDILHFFSFIIDIFILDSFFFIDIFILDILKSMVYEIVYTYCVLYTRVWGFIIRIIKPSFPWFLYRALCLIALSWAIFETGWRTFWLWWTKSYGMTPHWGITTLESFYRVYDHFAWYIALGYTFLGRRLIILDDHYAQAYSSQSMMDFWVMVIPRRRSNVLFTLEHETWLVYFIWCTLHRGIFLSWWWFLRHSCSLEMIRFLSHWSMRYNWVIWLDVFIWEHSPFISINRFLRWLDQDTDTWENMQRSLVISEIALYWGITLSLAIDLRDTSLHRAMIMSECIFVEAYHFVWSFSHWDMIFL